MQGTLGGYWNYKLILFILQGTSRGLGLVAFLPLSLVIWRMKILAVIEGSKQTDRVFLEDAPVYWITKMFVRRKSVWLVQVQKRATATKPIISTAEEDPVYSHQ